VPSMRLALLFALVPAVAVAQQRGAPTPEPPIRRVEAVRIDSLIADRAPVDSVVVPVAPEPRPAPTPRAQVFRQTLERAATPVLHVFGETGLRVTLPAGWDGPSSAMDVRLPEYALYTFVNDTPGHPLRGTALRIERVLGLNEFYRNQWMHGQTTYGYHGTRPVGPISPPRPGFGVEVEGHGTAGAVVFAEAGGAVWSIQVEAPTALWARQRGALLAVLTGVTLP